MRTNKLINELVVAVSQKTRYETAFEMIGWDCILPDGETIQGKIDYFQKRITDIRHQLEEGRNERPSEWFGEEVRKILNCDE